MILIPIPTRKGFTLVELSIALVIIGLLIGGILVAQSMIKSMKINRVLSFYEQHMMATENFIQKFNCLPGDCNLGFSQNGNGNRNIGGIGLASEYTESHISREPDKFWLHLYQGGFLKTPYIGSSGMSGTNRIIAGQTHPIVEAADEITNEAILNFYGPKNRSNATDTNWMRFEIGLESDSYGSSRQAVFLAETALAIDKKLDDGLPNTGYVVRDGGYGGCTSGSVYSVNAANGCALFFYHEIGKYDFLR